MATNVSLFTHPHIPAAKTKQHLFTLPGDACDTCDRFETCAVEGAGVEVSGPATFFRGIFWALAFELGAVILVAATVCLLRR